MGFACKTNVYITRTECLGFLFLSGCASFNNDLLNIDSF